MPRRKKADKKLPATPVVEEFQIPVCSVGKVNDDISRIMQETLTSICLNPDIKEPNKFYRCTIQGRILEKVENARSLVLSLVADAEFPKLRKLEQQQIQREADNDEIRFHNSHTINSNGSNAWSESRSRIPLKQCPICLELLTKCTHLMAESPKSKEESVILTSAKVNADSERRVQRFKKKRSRIITPFVKIVNMRDQPNKSLRRKGVISEYDLRKRFYPQWLERKWKSRKRKQIELEERLTVSKGMMLPITINKQLNPVRAFYSGATTLRFSSSHLMACNYCFREFSTQGAFLAHWRKDIPNCCILSFPLKQKRLENYPAYYYYSCYRCNLHFPDLRSYKSHIEIGRGCAFLCTDCGKLFWEFSNFLIHRLSTHRYLELKAKTYHMCERCCKQFLSISKLQCHQQSSCPREISSRGITQRTETFQNRIVYSTTTFSILQTTREIVIGPPVSETKDMNTIMARRPQNYTASRVENRTRVTVMETPFTTIPKSACQYCQKLFRNVSQHAKNSVKCKKMSQRE